MPRRLSVFLIAIAVFALDRWSKWLVETRFGPFDTKTVIPGLLNIVSSQNPGVAFGLFSESASKGRTALLVIFSVSAVLILGALLWRVDRPGSRGASRIDTLTAYGLACIFGGALGNVFDRVRYGTVTDFLDFYIGQTHWYTFNLADTAICTGAGLLFLAMWKPSGGPLRAA
ncbi:MAG: signal peptidase II [Acidobacteriota bacterium]|nr:signal peptidase II [Acidobacteriota bacterium]